QNRYACQPNLPRRTEQPCVEPFVGAAAAFCYAYNNCLFRNAIINDNDDELIKIYITIRDNNKELVECLFDLMSGFPYGENGEVRREFIFNIVQPYFNSTCSPLEKTALFYILRRNWFNGMYKGRNNNINHLTNNGPIQMIDANNLKNWEVALQHCEILCGDYKSIAIPSDAFVYVDPPYFIESMSHRVGYKHNFSNLEQQRCIDWCKSVSSKTVRVVLSNSDSDLIRSYLTGYADIYKMRLFYATARRMATEILAVFKP
ncbi:MAG: Dam family site-specific DNA-(adenine-N6)-methyltransferase, partial [Rhodospirillaceae bacterium]